MKIKQYGPLLKILRRLSRTFLDSTPVGVSLVSALRNLLISPYRYNKRTLTRSIGGKESDVAGVDSDKLLCNNDGDPALNDGEIRGFDIPIQAIVDWLEKQSWTVMWYASGDHVDAAILTDQLVTISTRQTHRHQYYSLLHEASHVDLLVGPLGSRQGEPYGYLDLWHGKVDTRTLRHRAAVVIDEIETWAHGLVLAKKLGLTVDIGRYRDFRNKNLKSYFEWAIER
jgi:hypothetical protein